MRSSAWYQGCAFGVCAALMIWMMCGLNVVCAASWTQYDTFGGSDNDTENGAEGHTSFSAMVCNALGPWLSMTESLWYDYGISMTIIAARLCLLRFIVLLVLNI